MAFEDSGWQPRRGDSTLIRRVCATGIINLPSCSGVEKPKNIPCSRAKKLCKIMYCIVLYCIVLYCIVLYCIVLYCIVLYCIVDEDHIHALLISANDSSIPL